MSTVSRRKFLIGSAVATAGVSAISFSQLFGYSRVFGQGEGDDPQSRCYRRNICVYPLL